MDRTVLTQRLLLVYSGLLTAIVCVLLLSGATSSKKSSFDEIDVKRINLVEPDGTLRMVIADKAHFPGLIVKGKEYPHDRATAGMLFFNDEGTENGGLIFGGSKEKDGKPQSWGHLSFDRYMGDQELVLNYEEADGQRHSGLSLVDQPDVPMEQLTAALQLPAEQRKVKLGELLSGKNKSQTRVYLGSTTDRTAVLELKDAQGRDRIRMIVSSDGRPFLQFLDELGKVIVQYPKEGQ